MIAVIAAASVAGLTAATAFWDKSFKKWDQKQITSMLDNSPWSKQFALASQAMDGGSDQTKAPVTVGGQTAATQGGGGRGAAPVDQSQVDRDAEDPKGLVSGGRGYGGSKGVGVGGQKELIDSFTVRFFSALPVRQAYVRMMQLQNGYDRMSSADRQGFDRATSKALNLDLRDQVIVAVEFASNNPPKRMEVDRQLKQATAQTLNQSAYLISARFGRVPLSAYYPPSADGTGAKLIFHRQYQGSPVVSPSDEEVSLEFFVPGTEHRVFVTWKVKEMVQNGQLTF
jgi:hypothetical protein